MRPFEGRYEMHQAMTTEAVHQFDDGFFDFIYVDATHSYMDSKADVESWWPKLRVGGVMAGDDYFNGYVDAAGQVGRTSICGRVACAVLFLLPPSVKHLHRP